MRARVSVLVPSHNYARFLRRCIDSVLSQTYSAFELVISDDASTDDSDRVIRTYSDPRIVYEHQPKNLGMVPNWRRCVELSNGEFLILLGADDTLKPRMLESCVRVLESDPEIAFCHTASDFVTDEGKLVGVTGAFQRSYVADGRSRIEAFLRGKRVVNSAAVFRRAPWESLGGWSSDYFNCMDADLWFRMLLRWKVAFIGERLVRFRSHGQSDAWNIKQAREDLKFLRSMFARLPSELAHLGSIEPELARGLCDAWIRALRALLPSEARDEAIAELQQFASPTPLPEARSSFIATLKHTLGRHCASLPSPARYLLGDLFGSL
jgi:glycosyltransferase involved in cell wall biosynthesis